MNKYINKNKNVLMVGTSLSTNGGMTTVVESYLNHKWNNCTIYFIPTHIERGISIQLIYFFIHILKIFYYLTFQKIDIIHIHFSEKGSFYRKKIVTLIGKLYRKKIIIHMHGAEFKDFYNSSSGRLQKSIRKMLEDADFVMVLGESWANFVKNLSSKIKVYIFRNSVKIPNEIAEYKQNNMFNVLFLGVLIKRKGIYDLVHAVEDIVNKGYTNLRVIIAGTGEEEQAIQKLIKKLNLERYFEFKGWVSGEEKENLIMNSQAFVLPSYNEGLPVGILEAMSYGVPVITTNVGSIEDVIQNNYNGYLINPGDIQSLVTSLLDCVNNLDRWNSFSTRSREIILNEYNENDYFNRVENLYNEC